MTKHMPARLCLLTAMLFCAVPAAAQPLAASSPQLGAVLQANECKLVSGYYNAPTARLTPATGSLEPVAKTNAAPACEDICNKQEPDRLNALAAGPAGNTVTHTGIVTECWFGTQMIFQHLR